MNGERKVVSRLLLGAALVHVATTPVFYGDAISDVVDDGVFNAVPDASGNPDAAFWYLFAGSVLLLGSVLVHRIELRSGLSQWIGWAFVAIGGFGSICKPASPFWLVAAVGVFAVWRSRRAVTEHPLVGRLLRAIAAVHTLAVVVFYRDGLGDIAGGGVFDAAPDSAAVPDAAFWFLYSGFAAVILAGLVSWVERNERNSLALVGWSVAALGGCGVIVKPTSGLWIVLAVGIVAVLLALRTDDGSATFEDSTVTSDAAAFRPSSGGEDLVDFYRGDREKTVAASTVLAGTVVPGADDVEPVRRVGRRPGLRHRV